MKTEERAPLAGRTVVITGAARGLGAAYARCCARAGATVIAVDVDAEPLRNLVAEITHAGGSAVAETADVADADRLAQVADDACARSGRVDGWVNNAGVQTAGRIDQTNPEDIAHMMQINVLGTIFGMRAAARVMAGQREGAIVNVTSGAQSGIAGLSVYGASKGAVASATYAAALDLRPFGIRVNAVSPVADTRMARQHWSRERTAETPPLEALVPQPQEIAAAVTFLLSDSAHGVTGQVLRVDGSGIALVQHPHAMDNAFAPGVGWSFEQLRDAFDARLRPRLVRVGL